MNPDVADSEDEHRLRAAYGEVPVPMDSIWRRVTSGRRRRWRPRLGELAATIALAVGLIAAGVLVSRLAQGPGTKTSPQTRLPSQGQPPVGPVRLAGPSPGSRAFTAMAYDSYRHEVVLFGGSDGSGGPLDDTWTLKGRTWTMVQPSSHPGFLAVEVMAYDDRTHTSLLVGSSAFQGLAQTWSWDGTSWTRRPDLPLAGAEQPQSLAFDPVSGHALLLSVLKSGPNFDSPAQTRMWTWDGGAWTLGKPPPSFADTTGEARLAGVGGSSSRMGSGVLALIEVALGSHETWLWDGVTWSKRAAGDTPSYDPQLSSTIAEDQTTGDVVLIASADSGTGNGQTWLWNGNTWRKGIRAPLAATVYRSTFVLSDSTSSHAIVIGESLPGSLGNVFDVVWTFNGQRWVSDLGA